MNYHEDGFVSCSGSHLEVEGVVGSTPSPEIFSAPLKEIFLRHNLAIPSTLFAAETKCQEHKKLINETMYPLSFSSSSELSA
jgi:hypothetical protein